MITEPKKSRGFERRILFGMACAGLPLAGVVAIWMGAGDRGGWMPWAGSGALLLLWVVVLYQVLERIRFPLRTLSNLVAAVREGDYSFRARGPRGSDALGELMRELNWLTDDLRRQRLDAAEATALLAKVIAEIDVAVFTFDDRRYLRLVNRAGERLLGKPAAALLGRSAAELSLAPCLDGEAQQTYEAAFPGGWGRWAVRHSVFRENGVPHRLLVLTDLSRTLREEERRAWQRLVRVLGHEFNNSLAPIKSVAGSLKSVLERRERHADWLDDLRGGLDVIENRAASLSRFLEAYARIAKLPPPKPRPLNVGEALHAAARLETRVPIRIEPGPAVAVEADPDQIESLLINLIRNAADAVAEWAAQSAPGVPSPEPAVRAGWRSGPAQVEIWIQDDGPGLANTANLFVPFFTTKSGGSGIGLALSRQIAEAHGGSLTLANREGARGCEARLRLPLARVDRPGEARANSR